MEGCTVKWKAFKWSSLRVRKAGLPPVFGTIAAKLQRSQSVPECLDTIDSDYRNVILVASQQSGITFNVDLDERIFVETPGGFHRPLGFVAEMTAGAAVDDDTSFRIS